MSTKHDPLGQQLGTTKSRYGRLLPALRYPDFRVLWLSTVSNQLGQGMQQVILGWLVFDMTGSGGMVGAVFAARSAPNLIVGFVAGAATDRLDRRTIMRLAVIGMMLVALSLAALAFTDRLAIWHLILFTLVLGTMQAFYMTARQVYAYDIVGATGAINGIALISLAQRIGGMFGALLAGGVLHWWGSGTAFVVMATGYAMGVLALHALRSAGESAPESREPILQNVANYFKTIKTNRVMLSLMVSTAGAETLGFSHQVMLPILANEVLNVGSFGLGVLTAFRFLGGAMGVFALAALGAIKRRGMLLLVVLALFGASVMLLSQSNSFWMTVVVVTLVNVMASAADIIHHALLQQSVPNEQRGRAMGSWVVGVGTAPAGQLEIGYLAGVAGARIALLTNGIALVILPFLMLIFLPRLRKL